MPLNIKHTEADRLARELADATGESITTAVITALRERLQRLRGRRTRASLSEEIARIQERVRRLPVLERRTPDEIVGYDDHGLPH